jgi:hypothetical protein
VYHIGIGMPALVWPSQLFDQWAAPGATPLVAAEDLAETDEMAMDGAGMGEGEMMPVEAVEMDEGEDEEVVAVSSGEEQGEDDAMASLAAGASLVGTA